MKTLIPSSLNFQLNSQFPPQFFVLHFPSLSQENPNLINFPRRKWICTPKTLTFCISSATSSINYGGWDDLRPPGESNQPRSFLNSLGIEDKKYIFMYFLGFACALAISRVRLTSLIVFPACAVVFAVGFSIGIFNGGQLNNGLSVTGTMKLDKDENFGGLVEKLGNLVEMYDGIDVKVVNLKEDMKRSIGCNQITVDDLERCVKEMEAIGSFAIDARSVVEGCIDGILVERQPVDRNLDKKSSKRRNGVDENGFNLLQFIVGLFQESSARSKPNKLKDLYKRESMVVEVNSCTPGNILVPPIEETISYSESSENARDASTDTSSIPVVNQDKDEIMVDEDTRFKEKPQKEKKNASGLYSNINRVLDNQEFTYQSYILQFRSNQQMSLNMDLREKVERWSSHENFLDSVDSSVNFKNLKSEESVSQGKTFKKFNGYPRPSDVKEKSENETSKLHVRKKMILGDDSPNLSNCQSVQDSVFASPLSSMVSDDITFNEYLTEANSLLKQAKECLRNKVNEECAESALYNSAKLLSRATGMKPTSLLAVGQLGNTYLVHGELKLKVSRELRSLLARGDPLLAKKWGNILRGIDDQAVSRDEIASVLIKVCEECEQLLVKAGRQYRFALSIDGNDMRALYNWGLTLSFRAQLIADIGPEAAADADKVFLAAIDKFDAMISKSNAYAPDALFRWGAALEERSRLRPRNSRDKVKLLLQAKRLYEDALQMDYDNLQVKEALSSCIYELSYRKY